MKQAETRSRKENRTPSKSEIHVFLIFFVQNRGGGLGLVWQKVQQCSVPFRVCTKRCYAQGYVLANFGYSLSSIRTHPRRPHLIALTLPSTSALTVSSGWILACLLRHNGIVLFPGRHPTFSLLALELFLFPIPSNPR